MSHPDCVLKNHEISRHRLQTGEGERFPHRKEKRVFLISLLIACLGSVGLAGTVLGESGTSPSTTSPLVGEWTLTLPLGDALQNPELVIYQKRDSLKGWMKGPRGKMRLKKIEADGNEFTFVQVIPMGGSEIKLTFEGTVQGDQLQGVLKSKKLPKLPFKGVRKPAED